MPLSAEESLGRKFERKTDYVSESNMVLQYFPFEIVYRNTELEIYIDDKPLEFDLNKDCNIEVLRLRFNEAIGQLGSKNTSLEYWSMRISERNTLSCNLFLDFCRISYIESLSRRGSCVRVYTYNVVLYKHFAKSAKIKFINRIYFIVRNHVVKTQHTKRLAKFAVDSIRSILFHADRSRRVNISGYTVIQTWANDGNFRKEKFSDNYYNGLSSELNDRGVAHITWPILFGVKSRRSAFRVLRHQQMLVMEDYLHLSDYIFAVCSCFKKRHMDLGPVLMAGKDFTKVIRYYQSLEHVEYSSLFYRFMMRLNEVGCDEVTFLVNHENLIPEKILILGVSQFLVSSKVLGYFHTTKPRNLLSLDYASDLDFEASPKPDMVLFNSDKYKQFYQSKYPSLDCRNVIAFKQRYLTERKDSKVLVNSQNKNILVMFPGNEAGVEHIFGLLKEIEHSDIYYLFRMHPMYVFEVPGCWAEKVTVVNDIELNALIKYADKVISSYSSVAVEFSSEGVQVGLLYDRKGLFLNPFDDTGLCNVELINSGAQLLHFIGVDTSEKGAVEFFNLNSEYLDNLVEAL